MRIFNCRRNKTASDRPQRLDMISKSRHGGFQNDTKMRRRIIFVNLALELVRQANPQLQSECKLIVACLPGENPKRELEIQNGSFTCNKPDQVFMFENDPKTWAKVKDQGVIQADILSGIGMINKMKGGGKIGIVDLDMCTQGPNTAMRESLINVLKNKEATRETFCLRVTCCLRSPISKKNLNDLDREMNEQFTIVSKEAISYPGGPGNGSPMRISQWVATRTEPS